MKLSIVVPCYNESRNIPLWLERFEKVWQKHPSIEVVIVNNGSRDNSAEVLKSLGSKYSFLKIVTVEVNQGYGFGILTGLEAASGDYLGWTHADLQTDPEDIVRAYEIIQKENFPEHIYVKGRRGSRPLTDVFFTSGMTFFEWIYLGQWLFDINAQPNIFHRSFYRQWNNPPTDFSLDLFAFYTAQHLKLNVVRFRVQFPKRIHGTSSWNTDFRSKLKFIRRTIDFSVKLKRRMGSQ